MRATSDKVRARLARLANRHLPLQEGKEGGFISMELLQGIAIGLVSEYLGIALRYGILWILALFMS